MVEEFNRDVEIIAANYQPVLENLLWQFDYESLNAVLETMTTHPDVTSVRVSDSSEKLVAQLGSDIDGDSFVYKTDLTFNSKTTHLELGTLEFTYNDERLNETFQERLENYYYLIGIFTCAVILVLLLASEYLVSGPLKRLQQRMASYHKFGTFSRTNVDSDDEIGRLAYEYNRLIELVELKQEELKRLATHDDLTGLPAKLLCMELLHQDLAIAKRQNHKVAVLFIDLDGFKAVNDTFGHDAGDKLLQGVCGRISKEIREVDMLARVGGDEFVLALAEVKYKADPSLVAEKIISSVSIPFVLPQGEVTVGLSIGIALFPDHAQDEENLLKLADAAMYEVKRKGKNGYSFAPGTGDEMHIG